MFAAFVFQKIHYKLSLGTTTIFNIDVYSLLIIEVNTT